jgi:hypothetical protein
MLTNDSRNPDLVNWAPLQRVRYSPHFDLPVLRAHPRHGLRLRLCFRCLVFALVASTVVTIVMRAIYG